MVDTITYHVPGLEAPADIVMDQWGIPHIRARTRRDVFFVQGFESARDRLWQIDSWRKRGLGRLAAEYGPGFLEQDRACRLFLYRGDMDAEWAAYGTPEAKSITEAFVAGVNAWIALTERNPGLLPPEFAAMGTRPEHWQAEDVVRIRSHALVRNVLSEAARAQILARADQETALARTALEPDWTPIVPQGLDLGSIPGDVLDVFKLATTRLDVTPERLAARLEEAGRWTKVTDQGDVYSEGSNNWVVAPSRTATGRPILGSDPHRAHALPSLRRIVHLTGPGIDAIGVNEPAMPGISMGHNDTAAFALTIFPMDQEDLYVYETHPDDPDQYRYDDGWERMRVEVEKIAVRGAAPQDMVLKFTRHGPVVYEDKAAHRAYAIRSVWFEPGSSPYFTSIAYMETKTPEAFERALEGWSVPSVNHVYADSAGNIAWFVAGRAPIRPNWDGLLPVPGDGRYEWAGFHPQADLPKSINPAKGFFGTANEMNLPTDYPATERKLGFEWAERSRTTRLHGVLEGQTDHSLADSMALQTDDFSIPAERVCALLAALAADGDAGIGLSLLRAWDHRLARDSAAAALYEVWWSHHLKTAMLDAIAPDKVVRALLVPGDVGTLVGRLERGYPGRDKLLLDTLAAATGECRALMGADRADWAWGKLHHGKFDHPLRRVAEGMVDVGPVAKGGSGSTVMAAAYRMSDFRLISGASFRMVVDVGDWDNSRAMNTPGQSGDPRSAHYGDLAPLWGAGEYVPLLYSVAAVDAAANLVIRLVPGEAQEGAS
jgi:penicillin G amidase